MAADAMERDRDQEVLTIIEAFVRDANYMADLVARFLKLWLKALGIKKPLPFPAEFLQELSAVIRIATWQRAALTEEMGADFPPWPELLHDLLARLFEKPMSFCCDPAGCPAPLARRVVWLWYQQCSWEAPSLLGAEVLVRAVDQELLLDALADVLWKHRNLAQKGQPIHEITEKE